MLERIITSTANPRVKAIARLRDRSERDTTDRFIVEGVRELERAESAGVPLEMVALCRSLADDADVARALSLTGDDTELLELGEAAFRKIAYRRHPDGILGIGASWDLGLTRLELGPDPLVLVLEGVEKPGNLGAVLRTADAAGLDAVVAADAGTDMVNPNVIRASQGAVFSVPVATASLEDAIAWCATNNLTVIAGSDDADTSYWDASFSGSVAIVVGRESAGIDARWRAHSEIVRVPMHGSSDSLNVATAAALLVYEALRQRTHA